MLRLVSDAIMQIDMAPFVDELAMFERFSAQGQSEIELELALEQADINDQSCESIGAASALFSLIESFAPGRRSFTEMLPLNLLARFNLSNDDLGESRDTEKLAAVISELISLNLEWYGKGFSGLEISTDVGVKTGAAIHLQLRWATEQRRLESISKDVPGFLQTGTRFGLADAWCAWRFLRKLA